MLSLRSLRRDADWEVDYRFSKRRLADGDELDLAGCVELVNKQDDEIYKAPVQALSELKPCEDLAGKARSLKRFAASLENVAATHLEDRRWHRLHLIVEEVAEIAEALATCDEEKLIDGCGDALVVIMGTAGRAGLGLALGSAFMEIMRSNFSKAAQKNDPNAFRIREKGDGYSPPRIKEIFEEQLGRAPYKAKES